jgi:DNA polymerase III epsilon subunit-like protein
MTTPTILIFDTETTGTDKDRDQIIELSIQQCGFRKF